MKLMTILMLLASAEAQWFSTFTCLSVNPTTLGLQWGTDTNAGYYAIQQDTLTMWVTEYSFYNIQVIPGASHTYDVVNYNDGTSTATILCYTAVLPAPANPNDMTTTQYDKDTVYFQLGTGCSSSCSLLMWNGPFSTSLIGTSLQFIASGTEAFWVGQVSTGAFQFSGSGGNGNWITV